MAQFRFLFTAARYDETVRFYTDVMGLPVVHSWDDHGRGTIVSAAGTGQIEIFDGDAPTPISGVALAWEVADVDTDYQRLAAAGVRFASGPADQPWGHRNATLEGPEGLAITLFTVTGDES